jgi:hypothetical protein
VAKTRVHELAKEFGIESKLILEMFKEMGEFVKSASSVIELPTEMRFRKVYVEQLKAASSIPPPTTPPAAGSLIANRRRSLSPQRPRPGDNPFARGPRRPRRDRPVDPKLIEASRMFGVPVEELKPAREERPRGRYASSESRRKLTDWDRNFIDDEERREWIAAGLGPDDGRIAGQLKDRGITPDDLMVRVDGVRASGRLSGGESVSSVVARLREWKRNRDAG